MAEPFLGEIRAVGFGLVPKGWALCNGQLLSISQNQALFSLLGKTYGGDGQTTFGLPNLQGRVPMHAGTGFTLGQLGGEAAHTLTTAEIPAHTHTIQASNSAATTVVPGGNVLAATPQPLYGLGSAVSMAPLGAGGNGQAHNNMPPYQTLSFIIALQGIYPTRP